MNSRYHSFEPSVRDHEIVCIYISLCRKLLRLPYIIKSYESSVRNPPYRVLQKVLTTPTLGIARSSRCPLRPVIGRAHRLLSPSSALPHRAYLALNYPKLSVMPIRYRTKSSGAWRAITDFGRALEEGTSFPIHQLGRQPDFCHSSTPPQRSLSQQPNDDCIAYVSVISPMAGITLDSPAAARRRRRRRVPDENRKRAPRAYVPSEQNATANISD